jgi:hypothetical protein
MRRGAPLLLSSVSRLADNVALSLSKSRIRSPRDFDRLSWRLRSPRRLLAITVVLQWLRECAPPAVVIRRRRPRLFLRAQRVGKVWSCCLLSVSAVAKGAGARECAQGRVCPALNRANRAFGGRICKFFSLMKLPPSAGSANCTRAPFRYKSATDHSQFPSPWTPRNSTSTAFFIVAFLYFYFSK